MTADDDRDPVVARALTGMPVPDHGPAFWAELDVRLAREPRHEGTTRRAAGARRPGPVPLGPASGAAAGAMTDPASAGAPPAPEGAGTETEPASREAELAVLQPPERRRLLPPRLVVAGLAAAVLLVVGALALAPRRSGEVRTVPPASQPGGTAAPDPSGAPADEPATAEEAVLAWTGALADGDTGTAWRLLAPASRAFWRSEQRFSEQASALAEGYGAWAASTDRRSVRVVVASSGDGEASVVALFGTVTQEGSTHQRVDAIPVRSSGGVHRVEPWAFGPAGRPPRFVQPPETPNGLGGVGPDAALVVEAGGSEVLFSLDGRDPVARPAAGGRATYDPPGRLRTGTHAVVVATLGAGWFSAAAGEFVVE